MARASRSRRAFPSMVTTASSCVLGRWQARRRPCVGYRCRGGARPRADAQEAGSLKRAADAFWPKAATTTICSARRPSGSPSAPVRRATSRGWLARARYAARMARARAHLGEARSGDATLVSQWLDLKYEERLQMSGRRRSAKSSSPPRAPGTTTTTTTTTTSTPTRGRRRRVTTTTTTRSLDCASTAAACRRLRRPPNAPSA